MWSHVQHLITVQLVRMVYHLSQQQSIEPSGPSKPSLLSGCLWRKRPKTGPVENSVLPPVDTHNCCSISHASCGPTELDLEQERGEEEAEGNKHEHPPVRLSCEVKDLSNGRTHTSLRSVHHSHTSNPRFRSMHAREKKATQMLAIVLGEWRPYCGINWENGNCKCHGNNVRLGYFFHFNSFYIFLMVTCAALTSTFAYSICICCTFCRTTLNQAEMSKKKKKVLAGVTV